MTGTVPADLGIRGIGVDVVSIARFSRSASQAGFLKHILADEEPRRSLADSAARFAVKEAVLKCLGTGAWQDGTDFPDVVVELSQGPGAGYRRVDVRLQGAAAAIAGRVAVHASVSRSGDRLLATAVLEALVYQSPSVVFSSTAQTL